MHVLDRIERKILLNGPRKKVWEALTNAEQFGDWFGVDLKGKTTFDAEDTIEAPITYAGYEHVVWKVKIERILPQTLFSFSWHPFAVEQGFDYDSETPTLVEFTLEDRAPGILLRVVESGFDAIPSSRRLKAFKMNSRGWDEQMGNIENYLNKVRRT